MKVTKIEKLGTWRNVADAARTTIGMEEGKKEPSDKWKKQILLAEHSPIRQLIYRWKWEGLKSWISVHFVRHKINIEHFVRSQRTDRTGINRDKLPQDSLVTHECIANAQSIISISRKRLCNQASKETKQAWLALLDELEQIEPVLVEVCVPQCIRDDYCYEMKPCGYSKTEAYKKQLENYRNIK